MTTAKAKKTVGVLAKFDSPTSLYKASEQVVSAGYTRFDTYSPFPIHGLEKAMALKDSKLAWIALVCGLLGLGAGFSLQAWVAVSAYPLVISGKPLMSWQAFVPVTFEIMILFASFGAVFGMFALNRLPEFYNPVFLSEAFLTASSDGFFLGIDSDDELFDVKGVQRFMKELGCTHVELLEEKE